MRLSYYKIIYISRKIVEIILLVLYIFDIPNNAFYIILLISSSIYFSISVSCNF